uniref:Uncharacterized protein n=1 Tax=Anguilla anguilla TaxID=7936 RepID=A0A0E9SZ11_ANGAN
MGVMIWHLHTFENVVYCLRHTDTFIKSDSAISVFTLSTVMQLDISAV